ncbi:hypothetical protein HK100_002932 [Physocladia obscura]|uniref:Homeobox domain-containing protein n=1 Tax=Physocladia obscura TaxID=109957 RepID=A0AAD5XHI8_9FUNG|nr:hypothetical protein HK100_002932 [Physocladia obscura]
MLASFFEAFEKVPVEQPGPHWDALDKLLYTLEQQNQEEDEEDHHQLQHARYNDATIIAKDMKVDDIQEWSKFRTATSTTNNNSNNNSETGIPNEIFITQAPPYKDEQQPKSSSSIFSFEKILKGFENIGIPLHSAPVSPLMYSTFSLFPVQDVPSRLFLDDRFYAAVPLQQQQPSPQPTATKITTVPISAVLSSVVCTPTNSPQIVYDSGSICSMSEQNLPNKKRRKGWKHKNKRFKCDEKSLKYLTEAFTENQFPKKVQLENIAAAVGGGMGYKHAKRPLFSFQNKMHHQQRQQQQQQQNDSAESQISELHNHISHMCVSPAFAAFHGVGVGVSTVPILGDLNQSFAAQMECSPYYTTNVTNNNNNDNNSENNNSSNSNSNSGIDPSVLFSSTVVYSNGTLSPMENCCSLLEAQPFPSLSSSLEYIMSQSPFDSTPDFSSDSSSALAQASNIYPLSLSEQQQQQQQQQQHMYSSSNNNQHHQHIYSSPFIQHLQENHFYQNQQQQQYQHPMTPAQESLTPPAVSSFSPKQVFAQAILASVDSNHVKAEESGVSGGGDDGISEVHKISAVTPAVITATPAVAVKVTVQMSKKTRKPKKMRFRSTEAELTYLLKYFETNPFPTTKQRFELANELNLDPKQILFWFQNRRATLKSNGILAVKPKKNGLTSTIYKGKHLEKMAPLSTENPFFYVADAARVPDNVELEQTQQAISKEKKVGKKRERHFTASNMNSNDATLLYMLDRRFSHPAINMSMNMQMQQPSMDWNHQLQQIYSDGMRNNHIGLNGNELQTGQVQVPVAVPAYPLLASLSPNELPISARLSVSRAQLSSATQANLSTFMRRVSMPASVNYSVPIPGSLAGGQKNSQSMFVSQSPHETYSQIQWDVAIQQQQQQQNYYCINGNALSHQFLKNQQSFAFPTVLPQNDSGYSFPSPVSSNLSNRSRSASLEMPSVMPFQTSATVSSPLPSALSATVDTKKNFEAEKFRVAAATDKAKEEQDSAVGFNESMEPGMELVLNCETLSPANVVARRTFIDSSSKPLRFKPTEKEFALMSEIFQKNPFPSVALRNKLAEKMSVDVKQVQFWFQNKRQTLKVNGVYVLKPTKRRLSGSSATLKKRPSLSPLSTASMYFFVESSNQPTEEASF